MYKLRWGVIGIAKIATEIVIPAVQGGELTEVTAISSRDRARAESAVAETG